MLPFCIAPEDAPLAWPEGCILCGNSTRPLVDTRRDIRLPGQTGGTGFMHTYACQTCIEQAMGVLGLDKRAEAEALKDEIDELTALLGTATSRVYELEAADVIDGRISRLEEIVGLKAGETAAVIE